MGLEADQNARRGALDRSVVSFHRSESHNNGAGRPQRVVATSRPRCVASTQRRSQTCHKIGTAHLLCCTLKPEPCVLVVGVPRHLIVWRGLLGTNAMDAVYCHVDHHPSRNMIDAQHPPLVPAHARPSIPPRQLQFEAWDQSWPSGWLFAASQPLDRSAHALSYRAILLARGTNPGHPSLTIVPPSRWTSKPC